MHVIETDRLRLQPLDESRLEEFVSLTADPELMGWWAPGGAFTRERAESDFAASLAQWHERGFGRRWIVLTETGAGIGFTETKAWREIELGWMLARRMWGHGYATEAGRAIRDDAFEQLERESVIARSRGFITGVWAWASVRGRRLTVGAIAVLGQRRRESGSASTLNTHARNWSSPS